ncbi:MAG: 2Fe-2S iron-sulfur cluster binding domain-containing protein [Alphaproteobacteria bacterium]|nr:2Fe-2S iron-sulfur cluster binding domain-containing protein [Alphaproteobacteria bacterium]
MEGARSAFKISVEGLGESVDCHASDTLLGAMLRAGLGIPYECNAGGCGSCKFTLLDGEISEERPDAPGLSARDRRKGKRLACICHPRSDCSIRVTCDPEYIAKIRPTRRQARLAARQALTHDLWEFRFLTDEAAAFLPGQYAKFALPGVDGPRGYSMSNIANDEGVWEFHIKRVAGGAATSFLFDCLELGETIIIDAPYSIAHLRESSARPTICIAGGSGLAPMVSILRALGASPAGAADAILYYGARGPIDVVESGLFADIPGFDPETRYRPVLSDYEPEANNGWEGPVGLVHEFIADDLPEECQDSDFYIAGPPPMVDAVRRHLVLDRGIPVERLHYDRFF